MISSFPESLFYPVENQEDYILRVFEGAKIAKKKKVCICGLVRQAEKYLSYFLTRVESIRSMFETSVVVLYENDSSDNTRSLLKEFQDKKINYKLIFEDLNNKRHSQDKSLSRRADMAYYRNKYFYEFKCLYDLYDFDYLIVLDSDICGGYSYEGILNSLSWMKSDNYRAIGSNSLLYREREGIKERLYYDAWAYRELGADDRHSTTEINQKIQIHRGQKPYEVNSAFGGLAVYDARFLISNKEISYDKTDCDHVTLHKQLKNRGAKIGINPSQIVLYSPTLYTFNRNFE